MGWRWAAILAALGALAAAPAQAADPATIMGKWIERLPDGRGMVTELAPDSITYYAVDQAGKPLGGPTKTTATYKDLGGDLVGVQFPGAAASGVMFARTGPDSLTMDFPGMGAHNLVRLGR